jgi:hypothetical protein
MKFDSSDRRWIASELSLLADEAAVHVAWHIANFGEAWGKSDAKEAERWAGGVLRDLLLRLAGRVSAAILERVAAAVDATPEEERFQAVIFDSPTDAGAWRAERPWRIAHDTAWDWPWERDEGSDICRLARLVGEEADELKRNWAKRGELVEDAGRVDGWVYCDAGPPDVVVLLLDLLAVRWGMLRNTPGLPMAQSQSTFRGFAGRVDEKRQATSVEDPERLRRDLSMFGGGVVVLDTTGGEAIEAFLAREGNDLAALLVAFLAFAVHERWKANVPDPEIIMIPTGRNELTTLLGRRTDESELVDAVRVLAGMKTGNAVWISTYFKAEKPEGKGPGRAPARALTVHVGPALFAWRGIRECQRQGYQVADDWVVPVFDWRAVPAGIVHGKHLDRLRAWWSLMMGPLLVKHRQTYTNRKGLSRNVYAESLRASGIPHAEDVVKGLIGAGLLRTDPDDKQSCDVRLAERFTEEERYVIGAGRLSNRKAAAANKGVENRGGKFPKPKKSGAV